MIAAFHATITVWLNGKQVHEHTGDRGWGAEQDKVTVRLEQGKNHLLIKCGNSGGPWDFSVAVSGETDRQAFLKGGVQKFDLETFRDVAHKNRSDAERGRKLFADVKGLAQVKCHTIGGQGGQVGPALDGIALRLSTMPNGLNEGMTLQDFADLLAFLEARRETPPQKK